jgi:mRNA interferase RelE/StbE
MNVTLSKEAAKTLRGMDNVTRERIKQGLRAIPEGDIKVMQGFSDGRKRLRVGKYRAVFVYVIDQDGNAGIHVIELGSRGGIYK